MLKKINTKQIFIVLYEFVLFIFIYGACVTLLMYSFQNRFENTLSPSLIFNILVGQMVAVPVFIGVKFSQSLETKKQAGRQKLAIGIREYLAKERAKKRT